MACIKTSCWRDEAELEVGEKRLRLLRERMFSGRFLLELDGRVLASATKPSIFKDRFELDLGDWKCEIFPNPKTFGGELYIASRTRT